MPLPCLTKHRARTHGANSGSTETKKGRVWVCWRVRESVRATVGGKIWNCRKKTITLYVSLCVLTSFCFLHLSRSFFFSCTLGFYCYYHSSTIRELYVLLQWSNKWRGPHSFFFLILSFLIQSFLSLFLPPNTFFSSELLSRVMYLS